LGRQGAVHEEALFEVPNNKETEADRCGSREMEHPAWWLVWTTITEKETVLMCEDEDYIQMRQQAERHFHGESG